MVARLTAALLACALFAGPAVADPLVVKDDSGRAYQLNDDGTYSVMAKGPDGKTYLLNADGSWSDSDEGVRLSKRFADMMDRAFTQHAPDLVADDMPKYKSCLQAVFDGMPMGGKRALLSSDDPETGFKALEDKYPDLAKMLDGSDRRCRDGLKTTDD